MINRIREAFDRLKIKGFVGPRYSGPLGKLKLLMQGNVAHTEVVSCAEHEHWHPNCEVPQGCTIHFIDNYAASVPFMTEMSNAYSEDLSSNWKRYFEWGQKCVILTKDGAVAAFAWIQSGDLNHRCHYIRLRPGEYRVIRGGVLPAFRRKGLHAVRHRMLLEELFRRGATCVYIDAYADNLPSLKGQWKAGYRELGRIRVICPFGRTEYSRWI